MAQTIKLKRSSTQGKVPTTSQLALGELAINTYDGRIFFEKNDGSAAIRHIVTTDSITTGSIRLGDDGGGGNANGTRVEFGSGTGSLQILGDSANDNFFIYNHKALISGQSQTLYINAPTINIGGADPDTTVSATNVQISPTNLKFTNLSNQASEATALMINGSNVVGTRELGSNAFTSTTFLTSTGSVDYSDLTSVPAGILSSSAITITTAAQPNITSLGTLTTLTVDDVTINGSTISDSGDLTLDIGGDLNIDVDGADVVLKDDGTAFGRFKRDNSNFIIKSEAQDKDIIFRGNDGGSTIDALTLDMSNEGFATFNHDVKVNDNGIFVCGTDNDLQIRHAGAGGSITNLTGDFHFTQQADNRDLVFRGQINEDYLVLHGLDEKVKTRVDLEVTGSVVATTGITGSIAATNGVISGSAQLANSTVSNESLNSLTGSLVTGTGSETLTNKTLTNPTINAARLLQGSGNILLDSNIFRDNGGSTDAHNYFGFNGDNVFRIGTDNKETIVATSGVAILKQGGNAKLQTNSSGVEVTGTLTATSLDISGDIDIDGTTNLDVVDIDGATNINDTTQSTSKTAGALIVDGGVGIAKTLNVGEDVVAYASSDERYKDLITPIENPNEKIKLLSGNTFVWNDKHEVFKGKKDIGVIAQEVEKVLPEIVETRDNGYKAVKYEKIVALLIESNKELIKRVEELEQKLK